MVRNVAVEAENNIKTINMEVQPESGSQSPMKFMGMLGGTHPINMHGLGSIFKSKEKNYMVA